MTKFMMLAFTLSSATCFAATLSCQVDLYRGSEKTESLRLDERTINSSHFLNSSDNRFLFQIAADHRTDGTPHWTSSKMAIHVMDAQKNVFQSLVASFNVTENNFRFDGGDMRGTDAIRYVGTCRLNYP